MKTFKTVEKARIKALASAGKTQYQIAKTLHTRKQNIASYLAKAGLGKRVPEAGAKQFWKDVKAYKKIAEATRKEAIHAVKMYPKWLKRRVARLSEKERIFHERWEALTKSERASGWKKERPEGMSERLEEDYEDYWETP